MGLQIPGTRQTGGVQGHLNLPPEFLQTTYCSRPKTNQVSGPINMSLHPWVYHDHEINTAEKSNMKSYADINIPIRNKYPSQ